MDVYEEVKQALAELGYSQEDIKPSARLISDLNMDSLELLNFQVEMEDRFGLELSDEIPQDATVGDIVRYIQANGA